jgi:hypothetical protein
LFILSDALLQKVVEKTEEDWIRNMLCIEKSLKHARECGSCGEIRRVRPLVAGGVSCTHLCKECWKGLFLILKKYFDPNDADYPARWK